LLTPGTIIDEKYEIHSMIGAGAMGCVYHASHISLERSVALKVIRPELFTDEHSVARFLREAQLLSEMRHPNIPVFLGSNKLPGGGAYIAMEYAEGVNLRTVLINKSILTVSEIESYFIQICDALQHAHEAGIIHRDLKPENIIVTEAGTIKVIDFGLAKLLDENLGAGQIHTKTGFVVGTPSYMSPEQRCGSGRLDSRSDIYSLGCILFECLIGAPPFDVSDFANRKQKDLKFMAVHGQELPPVLVSTIRKCLELEPSKRFQSSEQLSCALRNKYDFSCSVGKRSKVIFGAAILVCVCISVVAMVPLLSQNRAEKPQVAPKAVIDQATKTIELEIGIVGGEIDQGRYSDARKRLQNLLYKYSKELDQPANRSQKLVILDFQSQMSLLCLDYRAARKYYSQYLDQLRHQTPEDDVSIASALLGLAHVEHEMRDDSRHHLYLDEAKWRLAKAKEHKQQESLNDNDGYVRLLYVAGQQAAMDHQIPEAIRDHMEIVDHLKALDTRSRKELFHALTILINEFRQVGDTPNRLKCLRAAEEQATKIGEPENQRMYLILADQLLVVKDLEWGNYFLEKVHDKLPVRMLEATTALRRRDIPVAMAKYKMALAIMEERKETALAVTTTIKLADFSTRQKDARQARIWLAHAEQLLAKPESRKSDWEKQQWLSLKESYEAAGDRAGAARALKMASSLN
jgi:serine/threonine protein kinase